MTGTARPDVSRGPRLYSARPARRAAQIVSDALALLVVVVAVVLARAVHAAVAALGEPGRRLAATGGDLASSFSDAGRRVAGIPLVGSGVRTPFERAAAAADRLQAAGRAQEHAADTAAFWLALAVALVPIAVVALVWLPARLTFVLRGRRAARLVRASGDLDTLALRALASQPIGRLAAVHPAPGEAWRRGDPAVVRALAALELREHGLRLRG